MKRSIEETKLKAYGRRFGDIPKDKRKQNVSKSEYNSLVYVDEAGNPINSDDMKNYDSSNVTYWKPALKTTGQTQLDNADKDFTNKTVDTIPRTPSRNLEETFGVTPKEALSYIPYLGDAIDVYDAGNAVNKGNYGEAAAIVGGLVLPNIIEKPAKAIYRKVRKSIKDLKRLNTGTSTINLKNDYFKQKSIYQDINKRKNEINDRLLNNDEYSQYDVSESEIKNAVIDRLGRNDIINQKIYNEIIPIDKYKQFTDRRHLDEMFDEHPAYAYFTTINDLDPYDQKTVDAFIDRQSKSIRGVYTKKEGEPYLEYLTYADNGINPKRKGGDQFRNRGLYTSNSTEVKDKFNKAIGDNNTTGYSAILHHDFNINKSLPINQQLQQLQDRVFDWTILNYLEHANNKYRLHNIDAFRRKNKDIHAWESDYFGNKVKQRAYVNTSDQFSAPVADIVELSSSKNSGVRKNRFSENNEITDGLFLPQYPGYSEYNVNRYTDLLYKNQHKSLTDEGKAIYSYNSDLLNKELYNRIHMLDRQFDVNNKRIRANRTTLKSIKDTQKLAIMLGLSSVGLSGGMLTLAKAKDKATNDFKNSEQNKTKNKNK